MAEDCATGEARAPLRDILSLLRALPSRWAKSASVLAMLVVKLVALAIDVGASCMQRGRFAALLLTARPP